MEHNVVLTMRGITMTFPGVKALDNVHLYMSIHLVLFDLKYFFAHIALRIVFLNIPTVYNINY